MRIMPTQKLAEISKNISELYQTFNDMHKLYFKFSFKKIFPLTLFFKQSKPEVYQRTVKTIQNGLSKFRKKIKDLLKDIKEKDDEEFGKILISFIEEFDASMELFLKLVFQNENKDSLRQINANMKAYQAKLKDTYSLSTLLNEMLR